MVIVVVDFEDEFAESVVRTTPAVTNITAPICVLLYLVQVV